MQYKTIAVDVDDVCIELVRRWIDLYNQDTGDNLRIEHVTDWDISKFSKIEPKSDVYKYLSDPALYDDVGLVTGALWGVDMLRKMNNKVIFVTAASPNTIASKYKALRKYGFLKSAEDLIMAQDKSIIKADLLLDDKYENVKSVPNGWLFTRPWNKRYEYPNRVHTWAEFINKLQGVL